MLKTEGVTHFVAHHIGERLVEQIGRQTIATHRLIYIGSLHEAPLVEEIFHIVVDNDRSIDDFTRRRIYPRGTIGVLIRVGDIADARVRQVVGIKLRIILGEVLHLHSILETGFFKSLVPAEHTFAQSGFPSLGEGRIEIVDNGLHRFRELAIEISRAILGDKTPAVSEIHTAGVVVVAVDVKLGRREDAHASVCDARSHLVFGQEEERIGDIYCGGNVSHEVVDVHDRGTHLVVEFHLHTHVVVKSFELLYKGQVRIWSSTDGEVARLRRYHVEQGICTSHERSSVDEHSGAIGGVAFDFE